MLKDYLLSLNCVIDNEYLDQYINLLQNPVTYGYGEFHHVIPAAYYKIANKITSAKQARILANNDPNNYIVKLSYRDHCKAHWLLAHCAATKQFFKANIRAVKLMYEAATNKLFNEESVISEADYTCIQQYKDDLIGNLPINWTAEELNFLKDNFATMTKLEIAAALNKTFGSVYAMGQSLGLIKQPNWTDAEVAWLKENFSADNLSYCAEHLNRTAAAVYTKCKRLKLVYNKTSYTDEEKAWLRANRPKKTYNECASYLGRSLGSIKKQCIRLGLTAGGNNE